jgi:hypothetical protein
MKKLWNEEPRTRDAQMTGTKKLRVGGRRTACERECGRRGAFFVETCVLFGRVRVRRRRNARRALRRGVQTGSEMRERGWAGTGRRRGGAHGARESEASSEMESETGNGSCPPSLCPTRKWNGNFFVRAICASLVRGSSFHNFFIRASCLGTSKAPSGGYTSKKTTLLTGREPSEVSRPPTRPRALRGAFLWTDRPDWQRAAGPCCIPSACSRYKTLLYNQTKSFPPDNP